MAIEVSKKHQFDLERALEVINTFNWRQEIYDHLLAYYVVIGKNYMNDPLRINIEYFYDIWDQKIHRDPKRQIGTCLEGCNITFNFEDGYTFFQFIEGATNEDEDILDKLDGSATDLKQQLNRVVNDYGKRVLGCHFDKRVYYNPWDFPKEQVIPDLLKAPLKGEEDTKRVIDYLLECIRHDLEIFGKVSLSGSTESIAHQLTVVLKAFIQRMVPKRVINKVLVSLKDNEEVLYLLLNEEGYGDAFKKEYLSPEENRVGLFLDLTDISQEDLEIIVRSVHNHLCLMNEESRMDPGDDNLSSEVYWINELLLDIANKAGIKLGSHTGLFSDIHKTLYTDFDCIDYQVVSFEHVSDLSILKFLLDINERFNRSNYEDKDDRLNFTLSGLLFKEDTLPYFEKGAVFHIANQVIDRLEMDNHLDIIVEYIKEDRLYLNQSNILML